MRIRKKSLPRCRYGGRKNRRIWRGDICGRNLKKSTTMEIMTIESNAYRLLVEKIEKITAYVEESRNREETERKRKEEAESPAAKGRKADPSGRRTRRCARCWTSATAPCNATGRSISFPIP